MKYLKTKISLVYILMLLLVGCQSTGIRNDNKASRNDASLSADAKKNECLASCRKELIDKMDLCYRNPKNFVSGQGSPLIRASYLSKVKSCIATSEKFSIYTPGKDMCVDYCERKYY